jgi:hypothetical protein
LADGTTIQLTYGDNSIGGDPEGTHWVVATWLKGHNGGPAVFSHGLDLAAAVMIARAMK